MAAAVNDAGFSVLYQPSFEPIADVIFVHGLQGHPRRTWTKRVSNSSGLDSPSIVHIEPKSSSRLRFWKREHRVASADTSLSSSFSSLTVGAYPTNAAHDGPTEVFWPKDLLPIDRPDVRILTWGYDTIVTRGWQPVNKNNLFAHARDLLYALERERPLRRPIIFVAHSLSSIIVKEVLRRAETSREQSIHDIILSTAAVIFLGTPHRGSPGLANLGEIVRRTASTILRVDSNATVLRTLGCDSPELELCRESFTTQWREYNFRVKTFQEAFGLGGIGISRYPEKVVPGTSSLLDDTREHAETIGANHMDMVRFCGIADPGYQKVSGELRMIVDILYRMQQPELPQMQFPQATPSLRPANWTLPSIDSHNDQSQQLLMPPQSVRQQHIPAISSIIELPRPVGAQPTLRLQHTTQPPAIPAPEFSALEQKCLQELAFAQLGARQENIKSEMQGTCQWVSQHPVYLEWEARHEVISHRGMLWIKGKAGAGKSVILKKLLRTVEERELPTSIVASFFFNARGAELERNTVGMYRSLLHQILQQDQGIRQDFVKFYIRKKETQPQWALHEIELQGFIMKHLSKPISRSIYLFIDALDECKEDEVRDVVNYIRELTDLAFESGNHMSVCMSSRRYPTISVARCPEVDVEDGNRDDVTKHVYQKILSHADGSVPESLARSIDSKASHVFLWAVLVVEMLLRGWDNGTPLRQLETMLLRIPQEIEQVFDGLANTLTEDERPEAIRLFQWVLLSESPLSLGSLQYALVFGAETPPLSFAAVHEREGKFDPQQFARRITHLSRGLIEVLLRPNTKTLSTVQVIHESVRDWFFAKEGFVRLDDTLLDLPIGNSHLTIIRACTNVLLSSDFTDMHPLHVHNSGKDRIKLSLLKGTYWHSNQVIDGQGANLSKETDVLGITKYCATYIFKHAELAELEGVVPTAFLDTLSKPQSKLWSILLQVETEDEVLQYFPVSQSLLTFLCSKGFVTSTAWLLKNGKDRRARDLHCKAIRAAISSTCTTVKRVEMLKVLDAHQPLCSIFDDSGRNGFHWTCEILASNGETLSVIIEFFLSQGFDVNARDHIGMTGIMIVASNGGDSSLIALSKLGASIDARDNRGRTALHMAIEKDCHWSLKRLLEIDASPLVQDNEGQIPLHKAAALNRSSMVEDLLAYLSDISALNIKDATGATPLHLAALSGSWQIIRKLILAGADVNCADETGQTPLHIAARKVSYGTLGMMLDNGSDRTPKDLFGMTAADHAEATNRDQDIIELLDPSRPYS